MRLGVNARRLEGQPHGVGRYIEYLIKYWRDMVRSGESIEFFLRSPLDRELPGHDRFQFRHVGPRLTGLMWENLVLPRVARSADVLFCPNYTAPLPSRVPCVVATHSVNELHPGAHSWHYKHTWSRLYRWSANKAATVIAPSEATKQDIVHAYGVPPERIVVVPQGADDSFRPIEDEELLRATRRKYLGDDRPYILFVGTLSQRRNIPALIEAFGLMKKQTELPHRLLLFGRNVENLPLGEIIERAGVRGEVIQTDGKVAAHAELIPVYAGADVYAFPSLYEGTSLTTAEAMACGRPVIAADCPALRELVGDAARLVVDPTAEGLAVALRTVLEDADLRRMMGARSLDRARAFRWENCAQRTLDVIRRVAEASGGRQA